MDDILHILDLLRQRAQADILMLRHKKDACLSKISSITFEIQEKKPTVLNGDDVDIFEKWHQHQMCKIDALEHKILGVDAEMVNAKNHFKSILAKNQMMEQAADKKAQAERLTAEDIYTSEQLDIFLLQANK